MLLFSSAAIGMGWLRDLMNTASPPWRSFGALARRALDHSDWPTESRVGERSLAALFSKLDHGEQLQWLADRPRVQRCLVELLNAAPAELHRALRKASATDDGRVLRLRDIPGARPLDLVAEPLPPGIPLRILLPSENALWWVAPSGAGRSLTGRWLEARGRARFVADGAFLPALSADVPVFVELEDASAVPTARPGLCIAAAFAPPAGSAFTVVETPPIGLAVEALLAWAATRLPQDSRFEAEAMGALLHQFIQAGTIRTLGSVLGLIGVADEHGHRELSRGLERASRRLVERRLAKSLDPAAPYAAWLRKGLYPSLLGIAERVLADSDSPLAAPRTFEEWLGLVPTEVERAVDVEWMRLSLSRVDSSIRSSDIQRAAQKLPPGAFRIISSLEQSGMLVRDASERLVLGPVWLRETLHRQALESLVGRSPFEWGEALLRPHAGSELAEVLLDRTLAEGGSALEPLLDLDAEEQPAYAAAADLALRVAGVARLLGSDISPETLEGLWHEAERLVVDLPGSPPVPRISLTAAPPGPVQRSAGTTRGDALLGVGSFYLAALSVTEVLPTAASRLRVLDPWHDTNPGNFLGAVYDAIDASLRTAPPWRNAAHLLVARVRTVVGNAVDAEAPHPLEQPAQALDEIQHGVLTWESLPDRDATSGWLDAVLRLAAERDVPAAVVARAIWTAWDEAGRPEGARFLLPDAQEHRFFWAHVPAELLERLLADVRRRSVPYDLFDDERWQAFARALGRHPELVTEVAAWEHMPPSLASALLASRLEWQLAPASIAVLWRRFPAALRDAVHGQMRAGSRADFDALVALLGSAPHKAAAELLSQLEADSALGRLGPLALAPLRRFLHRLIEARAPGWRDAYKALSTLEQELRRVAAGATSYSP